MTVRFANLFYRASRAIRVEFTLPGGKPRSTSDIRVGSAFTTFTAWAWGDAGRSTVRIVLPSGFDDAGYGEDIVERTRPDHVEMSTGSIRQPDAWYRVVVADRPTALTDLRIEPGGRGIVVKAWPEDTVWRDRVADVLEEGLPALEELVGLPWPVSGDLSVSEVHAPLLHGYAGFYDASTDEIAMSEDLDDHTILHEASHAWFNEDLVRDRWIDEGLAEYYADRVRQTLGLSNEFAPTVIEPTDAGAFPLNDWPDPARIDSDEADQKERFGYGAAYTVVVRIAEDIGDDGMKAVLAAANSGENPYAGDAGAEKTGADPDWRRFLDLVEEVGDTDTADDLFGRWVVTSTERATLRTREDARDAYAALDAAGAEWAVPRGIRAYMSLWRFPEATKLIDEAEPVLALRDDLTAVTAELQLAVPSDLETPFEEALASDDLGEVRATLEDRIETAGAIAQARDALAAERTPLVALGLVGETPDAGYNAARNAFEAGDLAAATTASAATMTLLTGAESVGTTRAVVIGAVVVGLLLLLTVLFVAQASPPTGRGQRRDGGIVYTPGHAGAGDRATRGAVDTGRDRTRSRAGLNGHPAGPTLPRDPVGRLSRRLLRAGGEHPRRRGPRPRRHDGSVHASRGHPVRHRRGQEPHRPRARGLRSAETTIEALSDGAPIGPREVVLRIRARYRRFGLYETALLGMLAQSTGWATAAREIVDIAAPEPVISFGARHVHPDITDVLDYAAIVGGCVGASTPAGARLAGLAPTGTMPHSLVLIFGDTVEAALAFDRHLGEDVARIVLVDTFKDEAEEALRVAHALGDRLYGIRLDTPSERGRVTADLVHEVRARLDMEGYQHVKIVVSGGLNPERIRYFKEAGAPIDSYAVGSFISGASPIDFTGDIKEIDGRPIAKRGRIPGITESPRLQPVDLAPYRLVASG